MPSKGDQSARPQDVQVSDMRRKVRGAEVRQGPDPQLQCEYGREAKLLAVHGSHRKTPPSAARHHEGQPTDLQLPLPHSQGQVPADPCSVWGAALARQRRGHRRGRSFISGQVAAMPYLVGKSMGPLKIIRRVPQHMGSARSGDRSIPEQLPCPENENVMQPLARSKSSIQHRQN